MPIAIDEQHLLALRRECLPVLEFAAGGCNCEDVTAKVRFVLELAGEQPLAKITLTPAGVEQPGGKLPKEKKQ